MKIRFERLNRLLTLLLAIALIITIWNGWEGVRLNQRYEKSIHLYDQNTKEFVEYLDHTKRMVQEQINRLPD